MIIRELYEQHEKEGTHAPLVCTGYKSAAYPICSCGTLIYWESNEECIVGSLGDKYSVWLERMRNMEVYGGCIRPWSTVLDIRRATIREFLNI